MPTNFALDYIDVATRIVDFRKKHPEGSLQQVDVQFLEFGGKCWVMYTAAAYRTPDDQRPGIGTAWESVPGATSFTRDSEVQNAETAAWGRAIVAAMAADTKRGIASAEEVRRGTASAATVPTTVPTTAPALLVALRDSINSAVNLSGLRSAGTDIAAASAAGTLAADDKTALGELYRQAAAALESS